MVNEWGADRSEALHVLEELSIAGTWDKLSREEKKDRLHGYLVHRHGIEFEPTYQESPWQEVI